MNMILPDGLKEDGASRRRFRRFKVALPALAWPECLDLDPDDAHQHPMIAKSVYIDNMSLTGIMLISAAPFYLGTRLMVKFELDDTEIAIQTDVLRVGVTEIDGKRYFGHGARFVRSEMIADALPVIAGYLGSVSKTIKLLELV